MKSKIEMSETLFPESWMAEQRSLVQRAVERGWIRAASPLPSDEGFDRQTTKRRATVKQRAK